jgi:RNA polymerase subunit RPABC4/transcription elongation factor Spt4
LIFLRIISIIRTARDINTRTNNSFVQIISILLVTLLTPIIWLPLYLIMRPVYFKKDKIPRREANATNLVVCYNCKTLNPKEYNCCINCWEHLKVKCKECEGKYPHDYHYCNQCGAPNIETVD